jgi:hypothetical protein
VTEPTLGFFLLALLPSFVFLALAMERQHAELFGRAPPRALKHGLRRLAVLGFLLSAAVAFSSMRPALAWIQLIVAASCVSMLLALTLNMLLMPALERQRRRREGQC